MHSNKNLGLSDSILAAARQAMTQGSVPLTKVEAEIAARQPAPQESVKEARKLIGTYTHGENTSKVYKLSGEHNEGDPYHVKLFKSGKHHEPADYFTNDHDDAHGTAKSMVKEGAEISEGQKKLDPVGKEDSDVNNDGKVNSSDSYLKNRRKAVKAAMKEDIEQVDEISAATKKSYLEKATDNYFKSVVASRLSKNASEKKAAVKNITKRKAGMKLATEDIEQVDELSVNTLKSYQKKSANKLIGATIASGILSKKTSPAASAVLNKTIEKRTAGIKAANKRLGEKVEQSDMFTQEELTSIAQAAEQILDK